MSIEQINHMKRAAANRYKWGRFAARRYCLNRGIPLWAYRMACQLDACS